ncbi:ABC transporter ATP-binding protein [Ligilactobacillus animalis]|jgi:ABC-2 type transport system ATP-binding protein|uniref:ABC transporter ATP-binding protein n=1 Tax=Ligilactobacillus animalis TaxID=1605 RepID=UPI002597ED86|nr:ABC transporter ATP-binding protein [Ligilactobacillus animalis]
MLEVNKVTKKYDNTTILDGISFKLYPGEIVGLVGANGSGKTTLIKSILGLHEINSGEIIFDGRCDYQQMSKEMNEIGYLLDIELFEHLTAKEHIELIGMYEGTKYSTRILDYFSLNSDTKKVREYSYGMKQRLRLALAMLKNRKMLILDEPLLGLDMMAIKEFKNFLRKIASDGVTILLSSHQLNEIEDLIDRYLFLEKGNIIEIAGKDECYQISLVASSDKLDKFFNELVWDNKFKNMKRDETTIVVDSKQKLNEILREAYHRDISVDFEKLDRMEKILSEGETF